jgi:hypothetical protein
MDPVALAARIEAIEGRLAGTDAERRAAALCAAQLRELGRRPRTQTLWVRPQWALLHVLHAAAGVAASVVAVSHPLTGASLALAALVSGLSTALGAPILGLLLPRRATQNVVVEPRGGEGRVRLVLTAAVDAPRASVLARLERRLRGPLTPGLVGLLLAALAAVLACAAARVAGAEGNAIGIAQLVPSALLILLLGAFLDHAAAGPDASAPAGGPAALLAVAGALEAAPPRALAVEIVIAGAGEAGALGLRRLVRARRRSTRPEDVIVVHLGSAPGPPRALARDGRTLPVSLHPGLLELTDGLAERGEARGVSGARVARGARWPAVALEGEPRALAAATLRLVARIDAYVRA